VIAGLTIGSILLGVALVIIVVLYLLRPFAFPEDETVRLDREEVDGLVLRRDGLLRQIRELDDDMEAAKVAPELYQHRRPQLVRQAALIMQQLDAHGYEETPLTADLDAQIEAAVKRLRAPEEIDADIEAAVRQARARRPAPVNGAAATVATSFCPKCGRRVEAEDRFCPKCGHQLAGEPAAAQV
jgi:hypothetical protein